MVTWNIKIRFIIFKVLFIKKKIGEILFQRNIYGFNQTAAYKKSNSIATASTDYIGAIDKLYSKLYGSNTPKPVSDVELCYLANGKTVDLNWIIDIDGEEYITSTR